ncbi:23S rRNA (uracil(747)-C(5))-methyltransferase RlmC [Herbiconiux flava]|uniref:23S rRNA (Uracil747-C5)-methyltransferase n=1 Tax=Herbiconiux flava TaxID=881268 RepID=A0A852SN71_9MICO|nr:23S rRNA (uracil(747)-C(5))-methyltransferase RlmC [Herbiconiux flava]NYD70233.1 23S rRNA (uracil747-C5)-methyltransferase [Herbiconiux flava]GLK16986.1 23S rRNA (uracil(747)-C(5))-methyltransferase RlmC [Herbiconiux flava]
MQCSYFDAGICRSCTLLDQPYAEQLAGKERRSRELLAAFPAAEWLPSAASAQEGFRNKAKMVVGGTVDAPTLGILDERRRGVDLSRCPLCTDGILAAMPALTAFVSAARLEPYDVPARRGELKYVLVTESPDGELMVRFVVRDEQVLPRIRRELPALQRALPNAAVVSVNLQPEHKAIVEGEREIVLTDRETLPMRLGAVTLSLRPQSFFQTNTAIAIELYAQARAWIDEVDPASLWDLYCGVGGFALHAAVPLRRSLLAMATDARPAPPVSSTSATDRPRDVTGIEVSPEAVAAARETAAALGLDRVRFEAADATAFALAATEPPELVLVNPPRRGIGADLAAWLERSGVRHVVYSSCNPVTLASDLAVMPSFTVRRARLFDMFPNTAHVEVITLLERVA